MKRKKGFFSISAVSEMFSVHQQTIRLYEREGLINPKRSDGNTRLFSEEDVDRLEEIIYLTHKAGVNLAGVQIILKLQKQLKKMQQDVNIIFDETSKNLKDQELAHKTVVQSATQRLAQFKQSEAAVPTKRDAHIKAQASQQENEETKDHSGWEVEYEQE